MYSSANIIEQQLTNEIDNYLVCFNGPFIYGLRLIKKLIIKRSEIPRKAIKENLIDLELSNKVIEFSKAHNLVLNFYMKNV